MGKNKMRTSFHQEVLTGSNEQDGLQLVRNSAPLALKHVIHPEEIRDNLPQGQGGIGFMFHATDWDTLSFSFHNVKQRDALFEEELWNTRPFIASPIYQGTQVIGANIACPVPLEMWLGSPRGIKRFRETQFFPALELARQAGLNMVAMGASTPYACNYGALPRPIKPPHITTGHAATAAMLKDWAIHCCNHLDMEFGNTKLALFGAAGRLGTTVAKYVLYKDAPKELVLIDLPDKVNLLKDQAQELLASDLLGKSKVSIHTFSPDTPLPQFDGAILTSSTSVPYLTAADLKKAQFWIDDSHPRAASVDAELASREHTLYIECFARGPAGLDSKFPFRLPTTRDCYTCFAEGYSAWQEGIASDFIIGSPPVWSVSYTHSLLKKYGFAVGPFHGKNGSPIILGTQHSGEHELMGS
jgi:predicted amino acid dehydrogenase